MRVTLVKLTWSSPSLKGAITTEFREIATDFWEYMRDKWNVLDVTSITLLLVGFISRFWGDPDVSRNLYALAAPLFFGRILFFAQILPSQGPMIQVSCITLFSFRWL